MLMICENMTPLCQQLQISHWRLLLEYPRFAPSMTIGTALQINYPLCCPLICALYIHETLLLVCNSKWSGSRINLRMQRWKKLMTSFVSCTKHSGSKVDFHKCCKMHKHIPLSNHLNSVGAHLEVSLKTCKGIVGPGKHYARDKQCQMRFLSDLVFQLTKPNDFSLESILHCKQYQKLRDFF